MDLKLNISLISTSHQESHLIELVKKEISKKYNMTASFIVVFSLLIICLLLPTHTLRAAAQQSKIKDVLFIFSYHSDCVWENKLAEDVKSQLESTYDNINIKTIYLDAKNLSVSNQELLIESYINASRRSPDVIVVSGHEANELLASMTNPIVKQVPIVFCSVLRNYFKDNKHATGVLEELEAERNYQLGKKFFPRTQKVYVISDHSKAGMIYAKEAKRQLKKMEREMRFVYLSDSTYTLEGIVQQFKEIEPYSFVLFCSWELDRGLSYRDATIYYPIFAKICRAPIFTMLDNLTNVGFMGGYTHSSRMQGEMVTKIIKRILDGEEVKSIPIESATNSLVLDAHQLDVRDIPHSLLPEESVLSNKYATGYTIYTPFIRIGVIVLFVAVLLLFVLTIYHVKYRNILSHRKKLEKEREQIESKLKWTSNMLTNTFSSISEAIVVVNRDLCIMQINPVSQKNFRCGEEAIGKRITNYCRLGEKGYHTTLSDLLNKVMKTGKYEMLPHNMTLIVKGSTSLQITGSISPLKNSNFEVDGAVFLFKNITPELQQQTFLQISMNALHAYTWIWDIKSDDKIFSEGFEATTGVKSETLDKGLKYLQFIHPDDKDNYATFMNKVIENGTKEFSISYRVDFLENGEYTWWECRGITDVSVLPNGEKRVVLSGMDIDINDHKMSEIRLTEARKKAEESDRLKSAFLANMSHEIRTPLNGIVGFANLVVDDAYPIEERKAFTETIKRNSALLLALLNDILDLSRIESGSDTLNLESCNIASTINAIVSTNQMGLSEKVQLYTKEIDESIWMKADSNKLVQLLNNLISNAKKFTSEGSIVVSAELTEDRKWLQCNVADTGIGMPQDKLLHIFERFFKVNEFKQGTGLGLSICKAIVDLMGGEIWAESELGKGTVFSFKIPYEKTESGTIDTSGLLIRDANMILPEKYEIEKEKNLKTSNKANKEEEKIFIEKQLTDQTKEKNKSIDKKESVPIVEEEKAELKMSAIEKKILEMKQASANIATDKLNTDKEKSTLTTNESVSQTNSKAETLPSILVAEDNNSNYLLLKILLEKNFKLTRAKNGEEVVQLFAERGAEFDVILMDMKMPVMDGMEATKRIREMSTSIPIIAQTAHAFDSDRKKILANGCTDYITKPIQVTEIMAMLKKYIKM